MRILALFLTSMLGAGIAVAQQDSVPVHNLDEIVVEGQNQTATAKGLSLSPTKTQKEASQNGYDLLYRLAVPGLAVDPLNGSVGTVSGSPVSVFINSLPASPQDIVGMRLTDVIRVEYLEYPPDARFGGAQYVINYIVREYEYGGYTNISGQGSFLACRSVNAGAYSKLAYKRMTYDLYAGWSYSNSHHFGKNQDQLFHLTDPIGAPYVVNRRSDIEYSRSRSNSIPVTFRATYNTQKFQAVNTLWFNFNQSPGSDTQGSLRITPLSGVDYDYLTKNSNISRNANWTGFYYLSLPKGYELNLKGNLQYSNTAGESFYSTDMPGDSPIINNNKEDAWYLRFDLTGKKYFANRSCLGISYSIWDRQSNVDYFGNSPYTNDFGHTGMIGKISYDKFWNNMMFHADAGGVWERTSINSRVINQGYPSGHISWSYAPSMHHRMSFFTEFAAGTPGEAEKSPNVLQQNEFMYIAGNPDLELWTHLLLHYDYTWLASNDLFLNAFIRYYRDFDEIAYLYEPYLNGSAIIRRYVNSGWGHDLTCAVSVTYKPIKSLQLTGLVAFKDQKRTGVATGHDNAWPFEIKANYYLRHFNFGGSFSHIVKSINSLDGSKITSRPRYFLSVGWGNQNLKVTLYAQNFFRSHWRGSITKLNNPIYQDNIMSYSTSYHRSFTLSVSYTFGYGKSIKRGDEIREQKGMGSSVLE